MSDIPSIWAVVPAAGIGKRMQSAIPKQYLTIQGKPIIWHTLTRLLSHPAIKGLGVAIGSEDNWHQSLALDTAKPVHWITGGAERCDSVLNVLNHISENQLPCDWVMVHDAARPCLSAADLDALVDRGLSSPDGALLGAPTRDTMKRADAKGSVQSTVERDGLWHALTPQMFPLKALIQALNAAKQAGIAVTDDASAMEYAGFHPQMVEGSAANIKVTRPDDLRLAEFFIGSDR